MPFHRLAGKIAPCPAEIENSAVGRGDNGIGLGQFGIRVMHQFNVPLPTSLAGQVLDDRLQPAAIGNRPVQKPKGLADAEPGKRLPKEFQGGLRFVDLAVAAVHAGHVAQGSITPQEEHAARDAASIVVNTL